MSAVVESELHSKPPGVMPSKHVAVYIRYSQLMDHFMKMRTTMYLAYGGKGVGSRRHLVTTGYHVARADSQTILESPMPSTRPIRLRSLPHSLKEHK